MAKVQTTIKRKVKKEIKKNPLPFVLAVVFLVLGLAAGGGFCYYVTKNDHFDLLGDAEVTINVGETYYESGVSIVAFNKDASSEVEIESDLDINTPGVYAIKYTCTNLRFKTVTRIRYVKVVEVA